MKTATYNRTNYAKRPHTNYPSAAARQELFGKFIDLLTTAAMGAGAAAIILFVCALA